MILSKEQLLFDLLVAYEKAKKHKANKWYVKEFEKDLSKNLLQLRDELYYRQYKHSPFTAFVVLKPKPREIFAAVFRDRIVHHLYYEYVHDLFESTFVYDCYSCIKGKGTSFGVDRLEHHIKSASQNYTKECYVLKIDIRSYFININRRILLDIAIKQIERFDQSGKKDLDYDFIKYLTNIIILIDPTKNVRKLSPDNWNYYKKSKSLFYAKYLCGLPIGNLTSQLFSNVYLNLLDQYIKRELKAKHYGRYVDDAYVVSCDKEYLRMIIPIIRDFLKNTLALELHEGKTQIKNVKYGIEFLGTYIKPFRRYIANQTLHRMLCNNEKINNKRHLVASLQSRLGMLNRFSAYNIKLQLV